jgi:glycosyltransferase involved in cell wall biosynthesis
VRTEIVAGGPTARSYRIDDVSYTTVRCHDWSRLVRDLDTEVTSVPAMAWRLRALAPDLVHSFLFTDAFAAQLARRPYVVSYGGIALRSSMRGHALRTRMFWRASGGAGGIVCPSAAAATHLQREFGLTAEVIPNGLDVSRFAVVGEPEPGRIFCAATPSDARKRPEVLVDALALLFERGVAAHVVFAGAVDGVRRGPGPPPRAPAHASRSRASSTSPV